MRQKKREREKDIKREKRIVKGSKKEMTGGSQIT